MLFRDLKEIPKWTEEETKIKPINFLRDLTVYFSYFYVNDRQILHNLKLSMTGSAANWHTYIEYNICDYRQFCKRFLQYYHSKGKIKRTKSSVSGQQMVWNEVESYERKIYELIESFKAVMTI